MFLTKHVYLFIQTGYIPHKNCHNRWDEFQGDLANGMVILRYSYAVMSKNGGLLWRCRRCSVGFSGPPYLVACGIELSPMIVGCNMVRAKSLRRWGEKFRYRWELLVVNYPYTWYIVWKRYVQFYQELLYYVFEILDLMQKYSFPLPPFLYLLIPIPNHYYPDP